MKFTLIYDGDLPASGNKSKPKAASRMRNELAGRPGPLHVDGGFAVGDSSFSRQGSVSYTHLTLPTIYSV